MKQITGIFIFTCFLPIIFIGEVIHLTYSIFCNRLIIAEIAKKTKGERVYFPPQKGDYLKWKSTMEKRRNEAKGGDKQSNERCV
jgi:hypothetical protein